MTQRLRGWERRFIDLIQYELSQPFDWVTGNCGHILASAIRACRGEHQVLELLQVCTGEQEVIDLLGRNGGLSGILGLHFERIHPKMMQQADVGIIIGRAYDRHQTDLVPVQVGCVMLDGVVVGKRQEGIFRIPSSKVSMAFRV